MNWIATTAMGLEAVAKRELLSLGFVVTEVTDGKVYFQGGYEEMAKANLWLRTADRVLLEVGRFPAVTFDQLFESTKALPWEDFIPQEGSFPVDGKSVKSTLFSISDCQSIVKKAIASKLGEVYDEVWLPETKGLYQVQVSLLRDEATLTIDTSGAGLHKRGYRDYNSIAPLKETLAAALIQLSFWDKKRPLVDPFCGSGTILIEAAMIGLNMPPGLNRTFSFESWPQIPEELMPRLKSEAREAMDQDTQLFISGSDRDASVLHLAKRHVERAGVSHQIQLVHSDFKDMIYQGDYGCIVCNPPYGERMGEKEEVEALYREMGKMFQTLPQWSKYVITSHRGFERLTKLDADRKRKVYNGRIQCNYYQFYGPRPPKEKIG